tara:strand:- start:7849 stop:8559 length:711 start_codon:yes stop_codon:yes gene_type:complete
MAFKGKKLRFIASVIFLVLFFGVGVFFSQDDSASEYRKSEEFVENLEIIDSPLLKIQPGELFMGKKDAKVTIIDFASMSCPHCASFYSQAFDKIKEEYIDKGLVKFVYRDFPLNRGSLAAAAIAICRAGEFPEGDRAEGYHGFVKKIYDSQNSWTISNDPVAKLIDIAVLDGMTKKAAIFCSKDTKLHDKILQMRLAFAKGLEIKSTPTFFVNDKKVQGFIDYEEIRAVIESELKK